MGHVMGTAKPTNILMVDDDQDDIYMTMRRLSQSKITNGFVYELDPRNLLGRLAALELQDQGDPNVVILLDINMPRIDGFEVLQTLKKHEKYKDIPVLMLCTSDDAVDMLESFENGADGYLVKPIVPAEMLQAVNDLTSHQIQLVQQH